MKKNFKSFIGVYGYKDVVPVLTSLSKILKTRCSIDQPSWSCFVSADNSGMFIRQCYRKKNGKRHAYWALIESYRTSRGPRQRIVSYLGEMDERGRRRPVLLRKELPIHLFCFAVSYWRWREIFRNRRDKVFARYGLSLGILLEYGQVKCRYYLFFWGCQLELRYSSEISHITLTCLLPNPLSPFSLEYQIFLTNTVFLPFSSEVWPGDGEKGPKIVGELSGKQKVARSWR